MSDTDKGNRVYISAEELPYEVRMSINTTECPKCEGLLSLKGLEYAYYLHDGEAIVVLVKCLCGKWEKDWLCRRVG